MIYSQTVNITSNIVVACFTTKQLVCFLLNFKLEYWQQKLIYIVFIPVSHFRLFVYVIRIFCRGTNWLLNWQNFRRLYLYAMTEAVKGIILKHRHILLSEESKTNFSLNERDVISAATLPDLDDAYTR